MDFFEHQDAARRRTGWLVFLFVVSIIAVVVAINLAACGIAFVTGGGLGVAGLDPQRRDEWVRDPAWRRPALYLWATGGTLAVMFVAMLYKAGSMSRGGHAVAELMGGEVANPARHDADQTLLNVVEEMALASGVPVPAVYVMRDEEGINAFAAGFSPSSAVIGVTAGCLKHLTRDELQGVIAHEFSHILNGDIRLNLRLITLLYGVMSIGLIGWTILRSMPYAADDDDDGRGALLVLLGGLALSVVGSVGLLFGRLIQAGVSRQREYLADASAVQFTRNPAGIAGALKKIGAMSLHSEMRNPHAAEAAHMFFAAGLSSRLFATHPPIERRVRRIDPSFAGDFSWPKTADHRAWFDLDAGAGPQRFEVAPERVAGAVGAPSARTVRWAEELLRALPHSIVEAAHDPFSARALVLSLLMHDESARAAQAAVLAGAVDPTTLREALALAPVTASAAPGGRLATLNLAAPALRQLSPQQGREFLDLVRRLIEADARVSPFEWTLFTIVRAELGVAGRPRAQYHALAAVLPDVAVVMAHLARAGSSDGGGVPAQAAFDRGAARLGAALTMPADAGGLAALDAALARLAGASPGLGRRIVDALAHCAAADGTISVAEAELLRAITAAIGAPLPPLLARSPSDARVS